MKRYLCTIALAGLLVGGATSAAQVPPPRSTPPTFPQDEQQTVPPNRSEIQQPVETPSPASSSADLQARVQDALRQQLPTSADQVKVNVADDGSLQLTGTVSTDRERQQIEEVAHSAAPNHPILNKLGVSGPGPSPGMNSRGSTVPQSDQDQGFEKPKTGQNITPPNRADEDWPQAGSSTTQQSTTNAEGSMTSPSPSMQTSAAAHSNSQSSTASQNPSTSQTEPTAPLPQSDQEINNLQGTIQSALQQDPALANSNVSVSVTGSKVELTGTATDRHARKAAEDIAKTNAGGRRVVNHIKMSSTGSAVKPY